jgi:hypothetical protein
VRFTGGAVAVVSGEVVVGTTGAIVGWADPHPFRTSNTGRTRNIFLMFMRAVSSSKGITSPGMIGYYAL